MQGAHEDLRRAEDWKAPSERAFGLVMAAALAIVGLWPLAFGEEARLWALAFALGVGLAALRRTPLARAA